MTNYNNGKIYMIEPICEYEVGDIYIGSTTKQYLSQHFTFINTKAIKMMTRRQDNI